MLLYYNLLYSFIKCANSQCDASTKVSEPLVLLIGQKDAAFPKQAQAEEREAKATI